jgi:hypothetical protein
MIETKEVFEEAYKIIKEKNISFLVLRFITSKFQEERRAQYSNLGFPEDMIKMWIDKSFIDTRYNFRGYLSHWLLEDEIKYFIDYLANLDLEDPGFRSEMILRTLER